MKLVPTTMIVWPSGAARAPGHTEVPAGTRLVLDVKLLSETLRQLLRNHASDHIGRPAGRERHNHANGSARIALRPRIMGQYGKRGSARCQA
jgi:hypothetical protein